MNYKKSQDFGSGSMTKLVIRQALPLTVSTLAQILYNIVDRIFIGHIGGDDITPLTGIGLTLPIVSVISAFTYLLGQGGSPLFSIARGEGNDKKAGKILGNSITMLLIASAILTLAGEIFMKPILYLFGAGNDSYVYASDYLSIYLIGTVFTMLASGLNGYVSAQGFPGVAMVTVMSGAVINTALDPVFIFALGLGIRGAAIATVISQFISCVWVQRFIFGKKAIIRPSRSDLIPDPVICGRTLLMGLTGFIMEINNCLVQVICNRTLRRYGADLASVYIAIMTIVHSVRAFMSAAVTGITSGSSPVIGYNYGAGKYDRVRSGIRISCLFAFVYTAAAWLIILIFPGVFISLFSRDPSANELAVPYLHIFFMAYVFMALQFSGQSTFMALGKAPQAIFFSIFRKVILVIPLTICLPMFLEDPVSGVFWAEPVSNVIGGSASFLFMYFTVYSKLGKEAVKPRQERHTPDRGSEI